MIHLWRTRYESSHQMGRVVAEKRGCAAGGLRLNSAHLIDEPFIKTNQRSNYVRLSGSLFMFLPFPLALPSLLPHSFPPLLFSLSSSYSLCHSLTCSVTVPVCKTSIISHCPYTRRFSLNNIKKLDMIKLHNHVRHF